MKITAEPRSVQLNAEDFMSAPADYTIAGVVPGKAEQKYDIQLEGETRVWRPPLTVLRLLIACWGDEADQWVGHRVRLYCDPAVTYGRDQVGGIRVSHVSHIDAPRTVKLTQRRGKRTPVTVEPLTAKQPTALTDEQITECADLEALRVMWNRATEAQKQLIMARKSELDAETETVQAELLPMDGGDVS